MKMRNVLCFLLLMTWVVKPAHAADDLLGKFLKKKTAPSPAASALEVKKETASADLIKTLDDTLKENFRFKEEIKKLEAQLAKAPEESNLLKAQIRRLQSELDLAARIRESGDAANEQRLAVLRKRLARQTEAYGQLARKVKTARERLAANRTEEKRLKALLGQSILQSERDEFMNLLETSQKSSERAVEELSGKARDNERLRLELAETYYDLGTMFYEKQNYKDAITCYEKSLVLNPADSWVHHNLGILYDYYLGNKQAALYHYSCYLKLAKNDEAITRIRERTLELKLASLVMPPDPLLQDFQRESQAVELRETKARIHT